MGIVTKPSKPLDSAGNGNLSSCCLPKETIQHAIMKFATHLLALALIYGALWGVLGVEVLPETELFSLLVLVVSCHVGGKLIELIKLPPLLGMLIVGFVFKNVLAINIARYISTKWASVLRSIALVVILLRAGMGINPSDLKRLSFVCFRLAFIPCLIETATTGIASHFFLDLPWTWCFMLGFIISAVSAAIVVPGMLMIRDKGLGEKKGIPTLVIAASSIDNVTAITGFGVMLGIVFSQGNLAWTIAKGPVEVLAGLAFGGILGVVSWYIPSPLVEMPILFRAIIMFFGGVMVTFVSQTLDFAGSGAIGCISLSFVAALKWRTEKDKNYSVCKIHAVLWQVFEPLLFGLIGTEVSTSDLQQEVGMGTLSLLVGLIIRIIVTYFITYGAGLTSKERIFISLAWLPKATVQAAVGSVALDYARTVQSEPVLEVYGKQVLTIAVLSILLTAPVGAIAMSLLAPVLLKDTESVYQKKPLICSNSFSENCFGVTKTTSAKYGSCNDINLSVGGDRAQTV